MDFATRSRAHRAVACVLVTVAVLGFGCMTAQPVAEELDGSKRALATRDVGVDHLSKGRLAMAIRQLQLSVALDDEDAETHLWLGEALRRKGRLDDAELEMLRAIELDPALYDARLSLSALYVQMERFEEAIAHSTALVDDPLFGRPWMALTNRGWAQFKEGRTQEARRSLYDALDFKPDYWPAHLNLGILEREVGNHLRAITHLEEVIGLGIGYGPESEANYRLGELYVTLGRRDQAIGHFDAALASSPDGKWARQSKGYLELLR